MASKRPLSLLPRLSRLASPAARLSRPQSLLSAPSARLQIPHQNQTQYQHPQPHLIRHAHSIPRPRPRPIASNSQPDQPDQPADTSSSQKQQQPHYELTFTCVPCGTRSRHRISKHGYHRGSVLVTCPGCRNRHVVSDHLGVFGKDGLTLEDIAREHGRLVKKGTLGEDGDLEFWEDGSVTERGAGEEGVVEGRGKTGEGGAEGDVDAAPGASFGKA